MPKGRKKIIKNENGEEVSRSQNKDKSIGTQEKKVKKLKIKNLAAPQAENFQPVNQAPEAVVERVELNDKEADRDKKLFMWVGVSCLMVIFFVIWLFNLKYEFRASLNKNAGFNWDQTKVEIDKAVAQVKQGFNEIKKIQADSKPNAPTAEPKLTAEQIEALKSKLLNEIATGTASSTRSN